MKVYEVVISLDFCSITFIENGINKGFCLNKGDFIFIEPNCIQNIVNNTWTRSNLLTKIVYKKLTSPEGDFEWCEIDDINIVNPEIECLKFIDPINGFDKLRLNNFNLLVSHGILSDVTDQWVRDKKIKSILNDSV